MKNKSRRKKVGSHKTTSFSPLFLIVTLFFVAMGLFVVGNTFSSANSESAMSYDNYGRDINKETGEWETGTDVAYFNNKLVKSLTSPLAYLSEERVLSAVSGEEKWIDIDLSEQKVRAYEGGKMVYEFLISSGLPWTPTIKGDFRIWYKTRYTRMTGGSKEAGSFYDLPNVPFNMFFYKDYALHGAYWHNNFGHPMSHGCVNMRIPDAEKLFYWTTPPLPNNQGALRSSEANPGTRVVVHD